MREIEKEVIESVHKARGEYPEKFICPEVEWPKSQPDRFYTKPVIQITAIGDDEEVPVELTDTLALVSSGDTLLINR